MQISFIGWVVINISHESAFIHMTDLLSQGKKIAIMFMYGKVKLVEVQGILSHMCGIA